MNKLLSCALLMLLCNAYSLKAATPPKVQQFINHNDWNFVENKGQIATPNPTKGENGYDFHPEIKYYGHQGGVYLYCKPGMLSFVFTKTENAPEQISEATGTSNGESTLSPAGGGFLAGGKNGTGWKSTHKPFTISTSRTDLVLLNSNPNAEIIASDQQEYYENFYLAYTPEEGITNVHTYKTITYKSIYPNIDMVLNCKEQGMEYSFIVHPGGKVSDIQMQWNGAEATKALANGGFKFTNSLGTLEESAPKSFAEGKLVASRFEKNGFKVGNYDKGKDLVIDPSLVWATYYGGTGDDQGLGITTDTAGNVYILGMTESSSGIASTGAYQTSYGGINGGDDGDAFITKFNNSGSRLWGTYYGGSGDEIPGGICLYANSTIYVTGITYSTSGIATSGAYLTSNPQSGEGASFLQNSIPRETELWEHTSEEGMHM